ncbi:MAG: HD domain-containing protein, partial [Candidatus Omnitrophica bacterium]|nr:HD domain-containing protein [Candidatus Omnitrophota bacterium]
VIDALIPEFRPMRGLSQGPYHHLDVWKHTLETLKQLEKVFKELKNQRIQGYLDRHICAERSRRSLMKLGALFHDVGKPAARRRLGGKTIFHGHERIGARIAEDVSRRLKLSNDEIDSLKKMVFWHLRPGYLADNARVSPRAKFRYFRDTAQEGLSVLILSIADQRATRGRLTSRASRLQHEQVARSLMRQYLKDERKTKLPRLVTGDDLIALGLSPSPLFGKVLAELDELQAIGKIRDKARGLAFARKAIKARKKEEGV